MANPETIFKPKSDKQLLEQIEFVSTRLGESIIQPSTSHLVNSMSAEELKTRFPKRHDLYLNILRNQRKDIGPSLEVEITSRRILHTLNALDRYVHGHYIDGESRTLLDQQMTVFGNLRDFLEEGGLEGYIKLPTGTGKTVLFTEFIEATDLRALIVTPTKLLVDQTEEKFQQFAPDIETGKVYTHAKVFDKQVTITTYKSFIPYVEDKKINPTDYDLLILDEVHKSLTPKRVEMVKRFPNAIRFGFTATPRYSQEKHVGNLLGTEIHSMTVREAVEEGLLASLSVYIAKTEIDLSSVRVTQLGNYDDEDLERAVNIASRNMAAVDLYKNMFLGQKGISYCVSVRHAEDLARRFNENGVSAAVVSGYQTREEQGGILEKFQSGEIKMICNADILIEGFDEPEVTVCLNLRPTTSPVVAEQRAGRVLRTDPNNPQKHAYIVDFIDQFANPDCFPIAFAQILQAAHIFRKTDTSPGSGYPSQGEGTEHYPQIEITGIKVITVAEEVMSLVRQMESQKYNRPDENWLSISAVCHMFRLSKPTVRSFIELYRKTHPEYFKIFRAENNYVCEHLSPELIDAIWNMKGNIQAPIEGWTYVQAVAKELGVDSKIIGKYLESYREENQKQFRVFKAVGGRLIEHFSPEVARAMKERIRDELLSKGSPPDGWLSYPEAAKVLGTDRRSVVRWVGQYKTTHAGLFALYRKKRGPVREFISNELVELIKSTRGSIPKAEVGWRTSAALKLEMKIDSRTLQRMADKHRDHPEYFRILKTGKNKISEHFSPELISILKEERSGLTEPEEGWFTFPSLAKKLEVSRPYAVKLAEKYREVYPHCFKFFVNPSNGNIWEFVAPELTALIKRELNKIPKPVNGWVNAINIEQEFDINRLWIYDFVNKFRTTNPEYFRIYRGRNNNHISDHYSPELVALIKSEYFSITYPQEGWISYPTLAKELRINQASVRDALEPYQKTYPEHFRKYRTVNKKGVNAKIATFISPQLVALLKEKRGQIRSPEPGWINPSNLAKSLGVSTKKMAYFVSKFRQSNPEYFRMFKGKLKGSIGRAIEYYSPELVEKINIHFSGQ